MYSLKKDIFESARVKLTFFYVLIVAIISLFFSTLSYNQIVKEVNRGFKMQRVRLEMGNEGILLPPPRRQQILQISDDVRKEVKENAIINLILLNSGVIIVSFVASYLLAGKTLKPIKKAMRDQNNFIANASHELKTPISVIKIENEVFLEGKFGINKAKEQLNSNLEEINKLSRLVENIINQDVISETNIDRSNFNLYNLAEQSIKDYLKRANDKNINIKLYGNNQTEINADKNLLIQVFNILIDNAIKFADKNSFVKVTVRQNGFSVINTGKTIKKADIENIFNRFYTSDKSRNKGINNGYGLGLSIAKEILKKHNGVITAKSKDRKTTFNVQI